jgi:hypothetical protein
MTAVQWLYETLWKQTDFSLPNNILEKAKEIEKKKAHEYAEFAIKCDRLNMKILNFEDWIKL